MHSIELYCKLIKALSLNCDALKAHEFFLKDSDDIFENKLELNVLFLSLSGSDFWGLNGSNRSSQLGFNILDQDFLFVKSVNVLDDIAFSVNQKLSTLTSNLS